MIYNIYFIKFQDPAGHIYTKSFDTERERYNFESELIYANCKILTKWYKRDSI